MCLQTASELSKWCLDLNIRLCLAAKKMDKILCLP